MGFRIETGISNVGILFKYLHAVYFGRGAVTSLKLVEPVEYSGEFYLVADGKRLAKSTNRVLNVTEISKEERIASFEKTKLPYQQFGIGAETHINLAAYKLVQIEFENISPISNGYLEQSWAQIINEETKLPQVRFPYNLVQEPEYIPKQVRNTYKPPAKKL